MKSSTLYLDANLGVSATKKNIVADIKSRKVYY